MVILLLVLAVGFSFYFFVDKSSQTAAKKSELQFNVRFAKERVIEKVRFAKEVEIFENIEAVGAFSGQEAIYTDQLSGSIIYRDSDGNEKVFAEGGGKAQYQVIFHKADKNFLKLAISGESGKQYFQLDTEIQILNIEPGAGIGGSEEGSAIIFTLPDED